MAPSAKGGGTPRCRTGTSWVSSRRADRYARVPWCRRGASRAGERDLAGCQRSPRSGRADVVCAARHGGSVVASRGFEPRSSESKSEVLPLDELASVAGGAGGTRTLTSAGKSRVLCLSRSGAAASIAHPPRSSPPRGRATLTIPFERSTSRFVLLVCSFCFRQTISIERRTSPVPRRVASRASLRHPARCSASASPRVWSPLPSTVGGLSPAVGRAVGAFYGAPGLHRVKPRRRHRCRGPKCRRPRSARCRSGALLVPSRAQPRSASTPGGTRSCDELRNPADPSLARKTRSNHDTSGRLSPNTCTRRPRDSRSPATTAALESQATL